MPEIFHETDEAPRPPIKSTEVPQAREYPKEKPDKRDQQAYVNQELMEPLQMGEASPIRNLCAVWGMDVDAVMARVVQIITNPEHVPADRQLQQYTGARTALFSTRDPEDAVLSTRLSLAWYDHHFQEEPSKMLLYLRSQGLLGDQLLKKDMGLILSLLHSGITSKTLESKEGVALAQEILQRREAFKERRIAGAGVQLISLEDNAQDTSPAGFLDRIKNTGTEITRVNTDVAGTDLRDMLASSIAASDPAKPLTLVMTTHGMAQEGGYIALPNNIKFHSTELADMLAKRGRTDNVTIITTQCLPRSSREEDSFMDNFRQRCIDLGLAVPAVYMESAENQEGILNPWANKKAAFLEETGELSKAFQTMDYLGKHMKADQNYLTGADLLEAMEDVIGNQPVLMIPGAESGQPLNNDIALNEGPDVA